MRRKKHAVLRGVIIAITAAALIGGALFYNYISTDETAVPDITVKLNTTPLAYESVEWSTPVFEGLLYKHFTDAPAKTVTEPRVLKAATFAIRVPAEYTTTVTVRDPMGNEMTAVTQAGEWKYTAAKNGVYTYEITATAPHINGKAYGNWHYVGSFTMEVTPVITMSPIALKQGEVMTVLVSGMDDLAMPTLDQNISYAHFARRGTNYVAQIGVGYNVQPGVYVVSAKCGELSSTQTITVEAREFERQDMTIDEGIASSTNTAAASAQWRDAIWSLYDTADDTVYWEGQFQRPVECEVVNTSYGLFRYTNGGSVPDRHAGIDFDSNEGDPVYAPNNGRVVYAGFLTLTGNTVVIEHGAGLKSYIFHMSQLNCATNDMVSTGDVIGAVGSTGYSTGPHMHYEVKIGRQSVDPLPLLDGTSQLYLTPDKLAS